MKINLASLHIFNNFTIAAEYDTWQNDTGKYFIGYTKENRVCRFCQKTQCDVSFRKEAHAIPHLLGNNRIFSADECDECNLKFSRLESDLSAFFAPFLTINRTHGKKGVPSFKNNDKTARIDYTKQEIFEISAQANSNFVEVDAKKNELRINFTQKGYIPLLVYKCLCKIAISLLPSNELDPFRKTIDWILNPDINFNPFGKLNIFTSYTPNNPSQGVSALVAIKRQYTNNTFCVCELIFSNLIVQFVVPTPSDNFPNASMGKYFQGPLHFLKSHPLNNLIFNSFDLTSNKKCTTPMSIKCTYGEMIPLEIIQGESFDETVSRLRATAAEYISKNKKR